MKIDFFIIVFEAERFVEACIKQILPHANKIIIAEGAVELMAKHKGYFRSQDKTVSIINKFTNIDLIQINRPWKDKVEMKNAILNFIESDIIWMVDYDEFYRHNDIEHIRNIFATEKNIDIVTFKAFHFWKHIKQCRVGGKWDCSNLRVFRNHDKIHYYQHNFPHCNNKPYQPENFKYKYIGRFRFHYGYVETLNHIEDKVKFMSLRDTAKKDDYKSNLNEWKNNIKIKDGSEIMPYSGTHPEEIENLIKNGVLQ